MKEGRDEICTKTSFRKEKEGAADITVARGGSGEAEGARKGENYTCP